MALPELSERLLERRAELEQAAMARVYEVADPAGVDDPLYVAGLRAAVATGLRYGLEVAVASRPPEPVPSELLAQARYAARRGVPLETVLRRYVAAHSLLAEVIMQEVQGAAIDPARLRRIAKSLTGLLDLLLEEVATEYRSEAELLSRSRHRRRAERVEGVLAGALADAEEVENYRLDRWHVGAIALGCEAEEVLRRLASEADAQLLLVPQGEREVWAWLGSRQALDLAGLVERVAAPAATEQATLAVGEPARDVCGWRLTHRQALVAMSVARRQPTPIARYLDVALLAAMLQDEVLTASLDDLLLAPLSRGRDGGEMLRRTLRAYFEAGENVSSAAAMLGVTRHTVANRLHTIEQLLDCTLSDRVTELRAALCLEDCTQAIHHSG